VPIVPPVTPLATPLTLVWEAALWSSTKELALASCIGLAADRKRLADTYISGGIDGANHARLAMVVLVLCAVESDRIGVLDGHCKGWLAGGFARRADLESRVERATGVAGGTASSSSRSDGMVLRRSLARMDQVDEGLAYSGNPNKLDCVANGSSNGSGGVDPLSTCANLDLVGGSIGGRNASRSRNDKVGEMHGWRVVYIIVSTGEWERQLTSGKKFW
jgi:hypothetical protein